MDPANCDCKLELNPDITGIGVRAALYIQIMLGWFMSLKWPGTFGKNSRTAYMTATALLIASFIELETQTLSLLDGLVVSLITTMMITFAVASYSYKPGDDKSSEEEGADDRPSLTRWFMQLCFVVFWGAWGFHMWRDPAHFGLKGDAADCLTNYNITLQLFKEVHPTDPSVRNAALALTAIGFAIAILSLFFTLEQCLSVIFWPLKKIYKRDEQSQDLVGTRAPMTQHKYSDTLTQSIHVVLQAIAISTYIFLIYATEQTINKNDFEGESRDWSYGQTIALILLLQQIMDLCSEITDDRGKEQEKEQRMRHQNGEDSDLPGNSIPIQLAHQPPGQNDPATPSASDK
ncbi:hypothetical protein RHS03_03489, partial [Rhizoctonia solani]